MLRAKLDAEAVMRAKSAFFSNISHELRTPLHSIIGYSDLIRRGVDAIDPKVCAGYIHDGGVNLLDIVDSLLNYSRLEAGDAALSRDCIHDVDFIICSIVEKFRAQAEEREIIVEWNMDDRD